MKKQTVYHTLLRCPGFNEFREEMWAGAGKHETTDLIRLLGTPAHAANASKFLPVAVGKSMQLRHLNETQANQNAGGALGEDGW